MTKDEALERKAENARELGLDYEPLEAKDEPYAFEAFMYSNDRVKIDPVTGNVSIGTPQRTWVALTDEEIDKAWRSVDHTIPYAQFRIDVAKAIEAKLKEKNNE
jgi:hypothetical protein